MAKVNDEYEDVEGIKCKVKNPSKKSTVRFYQNNLREEIDKYISSNIMTDKKLGYVNALEINIKIAPFLLGWLYKPDSEEEYRVIKGFASLESLNPKPAKKKTKK
jgi:hypothetical protein